MSVHLLYNLFNWLLNQTQGKDGRKRRGTRKRSSLGVYWKIFRLVYERATGEKVGPKMNRQMHSVSVWVGNTILSIPLLTQNLQALRELADLHNLSIGKRENRCMTIEDLKRQIHTTLTTTEKTFAVGEYRILREDAGGIPDHWKAVVMRCLECDPNKRIGLSDLVRFWEGQQMFT